MLRLLPIAAKRMTVAIIGTKDGEFQNMKLWHNRGFGPYPFNGERQMTNGSKIKTVYGEVLTVLEVRGNMIYCYEGQAVVHVTKAFPL
jgi:hypothetical protein